MKKKNKEKILLFSVPQKATVESLIQLKLEVYSHKKIKSNQIKLSLSLSRKFPKP